MANVDFDEKNFGHCRCAICPVQHSSECVKEKLEKYAEFAEAEKEPAANAKLYCSIGKSSCGDLKKLRPCLCPTCLVWYSNNLGGIHYCTKETKAEK